MLSPQTVDVAVGVADVALGSQFTCMLMQGSADARCFGRGAFGSLGTGSTADVLTPPSSSIAVAGRVVKLAAGFGHACAVVQAASGGSQSVVCWGLNGNGQVGIGTAGSNVLLPSVVYVGAVSAIGLGQYHTCIVVAAQLGLRCWGRNGHGQLGSGTVGTDVLAPPTTSVVAGVSAVAGGAMHTCAIVGANSGLRCFGLNT